MRFVRCRTTSAYEAMILTPEQAYTVLLNLQEPERTLTLLASGTGLRISECLDLQWQDVSFADAMIHVRRTWTCGQVGMPKSKASKGPVPLHPLLADFMRVWKKQTPYSQPGDWVFPFISIGRQATARCQLVEDYLRPAAVKAGILCQPQQLLAAGVPNPNARFVQSGCETGFDSGKLGVFPDCLINGQVVSFTQSRNRFRGPSYFNTDFTILKNTKLPRWENTSLGLGVQFFNVLNHPSFGFPSNHIDDFGFGRIYGAAGPYTTLTGNNTGGDTSRRLIQLKAQIQF